MPKMPNEEEMLRALVLVFEMNGHRGVRVYAKHHGIALTACKALLQQELTGQQTAPPRRKQERNR